MSTDTIGGHPARLTGLHFKREAIFANKKGRCVWHRPSTLIRISNFQDFHLSVATFIESDPVQFLLLNIYIVL